MEYFQIADMFGKRRRPILKLHLEEGRITQPGVGANPQRGLIVGIENCGRAVAKFPSLRFKRGNFTVDLYGIDGRGGFGLPQRPSAPEWIVFGGGADHVVYPGTLLEIAKLQQPAERSQYQRVRGGTTSFCFEGLTLTVQLAADEFPSTTDSRTIGTAEVEL